MSYRFYTGIRDFSGTFPISQRGFYFHPLDSYQENYYFLHYLKPGHVTPGYILRLPMQKRQEKTWLAEIKAGNVQSFERVYEAFLAPIYRFILFKVSHRQDAEDLSSQVFLRAWQYLYQQQRPVENLRAFLYQVAKNLVIDFYRQRARQGIALETREVTVQADEQQLQLFQRIDRNVELADIERALRTLKDEHKEVVLLRYVEELSVKEIAAIVGKSHGAVRVILFRALKVLRRQIAVNAPPSTNSPSPSSDTAAGL